MSKEILAAFETCVETAVASSVRVVILTGSGSCFSAGANLTGALQRDADDVGSALPSDRSYGMYAPFLRLLDLEVPIVGALNGHAVGGGFGLAMLTDIRIANRDARYGANFAKLGIHSGLAISYLLPRAVGASHAAEMLFTGDLVDGATAERIGLVSRAVAGPEVLPEAEALATRIRNAAPLAVRAMKRTLNAEHHQAIRHAARAEAYAQAETIATHDASEGVRALLEKRPPVFEGR